MPRNNIPLALFHEESSELVGCLNCVSHLKIHNINSQLQAPGVPFIINRMCLQKTPIYNLFCRENQGIHVQYRR